MRDRFRRRQGPRDRFRRRRTHHLIVDLVEHRVGRRHERRNRVRRARAHRLTAARNEPVHRQTPAWVAYPLRNWDEDLQAQARGQVAIVERRVDLAGDRAHRRVGVVRHSAAAYRKGRADAPVVVGLVAAVADLRARKLGESVAANSRSSNHRRQRVIHRVRSRHLRASS